MPCATFSHAQGDAQMDVRYPKRCDRPMTDFWRKISARLGRDRVFWLVVLGIFLAYMLSQASVGLNLLFTLVALLIAITVHECSHAWVAERLGDPTARLMGRVSLNPLRHLDPTGTVMMLITAFTGMGIGWGKPVPVVPYRLKYGARRGEALVAASGPVSNLLVAALFGIVLRVAVGALSSALWLLMLLNAIVITNIAIAMFNLLPLPPLDGHSVLLGLLSLSKGRWAWDATQFIDGLRRYGPILLLGIIIFSQFLGLNLIGWLIGPPISFFYRLILGPLA